MKSDFLVCVTDKLINNYTLKKTPPAKPPRVFRPVKQSIESDNLQTSSQETILTNNVHYESLVNDNIRLYIT